MKRHLSFLAAVLAASAAAPALAQQDPGKMFVINAVTPGVVSFSGEGTAQFNNSSSTSNAFSVGSSTNFGVNAAASSTNDYMVDSNALLQLSGTSQLQQTIGTSSSAANTMAAAEAASMAADSIANRTTTAEFGQSWDDYVAINGGTFTGTAAPATIATATGGYEGEFTSKQAYEAAKKDFFNEQMTEAFSNVTTASTESSSQGASGQGIIRGEFITTNQNSSEIGATAGSSSSNTASATATANETFGSSYEEYSNKFAQYAGADGLLTNATEIAAAKAAGIEYNEGTGTKLGNTDWTSARQETIDSLYSALQLAAASQGSVNTDSSATVTVTGVGSIATLNSSDQSAFNVDVATRLRNSIPETNGTANGSAGGNLATSSFANQSNTLSASAFIQAFGPNTVQLKSDDAGNLVGASIQGRLAVELATTDANGKTPTTTISGNTTTTSTPIVPTRITVPE